MRSWSSHYIRAVFGAVALWAGCCQSPALATLRTYSSSSDAILDIVEGLRQRPRGSHFIPPEGWLIADSSQLPKTIQLMTVGKGKKEYPPSINLACEPYKGTLKDYLALVKEINSSEGREWKNLGQLQTDCGTANLSQVDDITQWGRVRMMHIILLKDGFIHVMTAAALKDEFSQFRPQFLKAMKSLRVNPNALEMVEDTTRRETLQQQCLQLKQEWLAFVSTHQRETRGCSSAKAIFQTLFAHELFQNGAWLPFWRQIADQFPERHHCWHEGLVSELREQLMATLASQEPTNEEVCQNEPRSVSNEPSQPIEEPQDVAVVSCGSCSSQSLRAARGAGL